MRGGKRRERERKEAISTKPPPDTRYLKEEEKSSLRRTGMPCGFAGSIFQNKRIKWPAKVRGRKVSTYRYEKFDWTFRLVGYGKRACANMLCICTRLQTHEGRFELKKYPDLLLLPPTTVSPPFYAPLAHPILLLKKGESPSVQRSPIHN